MKNILVIGASGGIGLALCKHLAGAHKVYAVSRSLSPELNETGAVVFEEDVNLSRNFVSQLPDTLHGLVYCPGSINLKPFARLSEEDLLQDLRQNVLSAVAVTQAVLPQLKRSGSAAVIYFSTVAVKMGMPFHSAVAMCKGAIEGLTRSLAAELAVHSIRVNAIAPSLTDTPLASAFLSSPEKREAAAKRHPLNKVGKPEDLAALCAFLLGEQSQWMTGQVLAVDGGLGSLRV